MNKKRFLWLIIIFASTIIIGFLGVFGWEAFKNDEQTEDERLPEEQENIEFSEKEGLSWYWSRGQCEGQGPIEFGSSPMRMEDIGSIVPYGLMVGAHVTPIDHQYFSPIIFNSPRDKYEVRAIADGTIVDIQRRLKSTEEGDSALIDEYRTVIEYSCTFYSYFDLITSLSSDLKEQLDDFDNKTYWSVRIPIKEGQLVGRIGGQTLDFGVYNTDVKLGFINPDSYQSEPWKIHTDETFKYFKEPIRSQLIGKNIRKTEPINGKIDYDIDGKLVGNWFKQGTNGYQGSNEQRYWEGHLAVVYDYVDPTQIRISIGDFDGQSKQFGVNGNAPDPKEADQDSGLVKYELVDFLYYDKDTGEHWDIMSPIDNPGSRNSPNSVQGAVLFQLIEDQKLKVEVFPGKSGQQVFGFTDGAIVYER